MKFSPESNLGYRRSLVRLIIAPTHFGIFYADYSEVSIRFWGYQGAELSQKRAGFHERCGV